MFPGFCPENNLFITLLRHKYKVVFSEQPDYIIASIFGTEYLKYDCIRICWASESLTPDFNLYDYAIGYDILEFGDRYFRMPLFHFYGGNLIDTAKNKIKFTEEDLQKKKKFANFVYSNIHADIYRENLLDALNKYRTVISAGRYRNNLDDGQPIKDKMALLKECKFTIACENSFYPGYTTEKILEAFSAQTIPIYWGNPKIELDFNEKAFINCHNFSSIEEVVAEVQRIDMDDELYLSIMRERTFQKGVLETRIELFKQFLYHIFDQDVLEAKRRNESVRGGLYEKQKNREKLLQDIGNKCFDKVYPIIQKIRRN